MGAAAMARLAVLHGRAETVTGETGTNLPARNVSAAQPVG